MATTTESQRLILDRVVSLEKELEVAQMAKTRAERDVRAQETIIGLLEVSISGLRADLDTLGYVAVEEPSA